MDLVWGAGQAEFYKDKLGLQEDGTDPDGSVFLCDTIINMAMVPEGLTEKTGIQYLGIQVDDWDATAKWFAAMGRPFEAPADPDAELTVYDPEDNLLVLSQKGWSE